MLLAACGPAAPVVQTVTVKETQVVNVPAQKTVVRLSGWVSSPAETALLEQLLLDFSVADPDIVVKYEPITGDYRQAMLTSLSSGTEPDVFYVDIAYFQEWAKKDVLLPLDDLMASTGVKKEDFIPSLMNAFVTDGKVYGIPKDFNTLGLFYNTALFDKAGLAYPSDTWTWDDLKSAAQKLTDPSDSKKPVYGLCTASDAGRFPIFVFQNGGSIMTPDFSDTTLDSPEAIAAADYYTSFRKDKIGAVPADVGEGWQGTVFGKGQCAMVYEGGWLIPYLAQSFPDLKYGVALPPKGKAEGNLIFTVSWSISKNTKNPEAAWKVIDFLTNAASQKTVLDSGFALPTRISLQGSDYLKNNPAAATIFNGSLHGAVPFYWGPAGNDVNDQIGKALERIALQNEAVDASLKEAADAIRKAIQQAQ
jgi:multiple sugar transport system substrate-binding protein